MKLKKSIQEKLKQLHLTNSSQLFKVIPTPEFIREARALKAKYPNIGDDFRSLKNIFKKDPLSYAKPLGKGCYKIRMGISDKNAGKSGGARVIFHIKMIDKIVYVLSVYDKSEIGNLQEGALGDLLKRMLKMAHVPK